MIVLLLFLVLLEGFLGLFKLIPLLDLDCPSLVQLGLLFIKCFLELMELLLPRFYGLNASLASTMYFGGLRMIFTS